MKKFILFLVLIFCALSFGQILNTPKSYFNFIRQEKGNVSKAISNYIFVLAHDNKIEDVNNSKNILVSVIRKSREKISVLKNGFQGDLVFQNVYLDYLNSTEKQLNTDYITLANFKNVAEMSFDDMKKYLSDRKNIQVEVKNQAAKLNKSEIEFATKYKLPLQTGDNDLSKKMKVAVDVFDNHSELYLMFFKVNIAHYNYMNAINNKNISLVRTTSDILSKYANEGLTKLKIFKPYDNDASLMEITKEVLDTDKQETADFTPFIISYLDDCSAFSSAKKQQDTNDDKFGNEKTKAFNELVSKMNASIVSFNLKNNEISNKQKTMLDRWNIAGEQFLRTHIPKN